MRKSLAEYTLEKSWGIPSETGTTNVPLSQRMQKKSWAAVGKLLPAGWGTCFFSFNQHLWDHTWSLCAVLGFSVQGWWIRHGNSGESPNKSIRMEETRAGIAQSEEEKALGRFHQCENIRKEVLKKFQAFLQWYPVTESECTQWRTEGPAWTLETCFLWRWLIIGTGSPERLWRYSPHLGDIQK